MIVTVGTALLCVTMSDAVAVHPLAVSVTVTVYVAGEETLLAAIVGPLLQANVMPTAGFGVAVRVSLVVVQVN